MRRETTATHTRLVFDSFDEFVSHNETAEDHRSHSMQRNPTWCGGAASMAEACKMARTGLPREGIDALAIAESRVHQMDRDLISQQFQFTYDVSGSDVDVARFLSGEPECMISYYLDDRERPERIVTLVIALNVPCGVSATAITEHGRRLMSLVEAIERTGLQTEIWGDSTVSSRGRGGVMKYTGRQSIRLKGAGELFDAGMFMFALTHPSMLRGLIMNTMHEYPEKFHNHLRIPPAYGYNASELIRRNPEDYPSGAIFIPAIMSDYQAGDIVKDTLRKLNLLDG